MLNETLEKLLREARKIIRDFGLTEKMLGDTQVYVFLTLLGMSPDSEWKDVTNKCWGITPIMNKMRELGWADFKPNTRETIRDECVGVLVDAHLATPNPDDPTRSKNSKHYCYQINQEVVEVIKLFGTEAYSQVLTIFLSEYETLQQRYEAERKKIRIPVKLPNGQEITLSPGGQNPLIASIVELFAPQFQLDLVLYIGDAEKRYQSIFEKDFLKSLNINVNELEKSIQMPDVILYSSEKTTLVIIEAVKTGGEINVERRDNLLKLFAGCTANISFVNAF